jgi:hypothetical protein
MSRFTLILCFLLLGTAACPNACVENWYTKEIGVKEATGKNDGPRVEAYLKTVGLGKGYSWCAAFVKTGLNHCGIPNKINGWAPTAVNGFPVYEGGEWITEPEPGDVFGIYSYSQKRIVHVGFYHRTKGYSIITVEGNTNGSGSANGDGVYKRMRPLYSINKISRWL